MTTSSERMRAWTGPAILSNGFRPLFLLAGLWATLAMVLWIGMLSGQISLPTAFDPVSWHAHEFLWGYLGAVMAGFLLTAVPNWTGRLPIVGWPLAGLVVLWLIGRIAVAVSAHLPPAVVALCDLSFLTALALALLREIVVGRNWRNLPVIVLLALFVAMNAIFHAQAAKGDFAADGIAARGAIAVAVMLIALIGGRVVPSFTRNWLARQEPGTMPASAGRADVACLAITFVALAGWAITPQAVLSGGLGLMAGAANLWRLSRWAGRRTLGEPLLWVLHAGFAFVPLGFLLIAGAALWPQVFPAVSAMHAWLAGAIGTMTLAMMTRASLGHTGRALHADRATTAVFVLITGASVLRVAAGFVPGSGWLVDLAGVCWVLAFGLFTLRYAPLYLLPRQIAGRRPAR
jgi:uncharacterized protein involved in response to NO